MQVTGLFVGAVAHRGGIRQTTSMGRARVGGLVALAAVCTLVTGAQAAGPRESTVARHHRKGVHCMEVLERNACAIENFEAVLAERTTERDLVGDAMLRLVKLHRKDGDADAVKNVMRRFWDVGMKRNSMGHLPYGARFFPAEFDILLAADMRTVAEAPLTRRFSDYAELIFTCDDLRKSEVREEIQWKRARRKAQIEGRPAYEIIYEEMDERDRRRKEYESRRTSRQPPGARDAEGESREPVFAVASCPLARALGDDDLRAWHRVAGAMSHQDFSRSMAALQIPGLDAKTAAAVEAGALTRVAKDHWVLPDLDYAGHAVHVAKIDLDEVLMAPDHLIESALAARRSRKPRMHRDVSKLVSETPKDAAFFAVATQASMEGMGFSGMRESTAGFLRSLLPKPKGLQVATLIHEDLGLFTRMPTDSTVRAKMLVSLAQVIVDGQTRDDRELEQFLRHLDIAEAEDRRALLLTYLLTPGDIQKMIDA
jgi:hypothetical protein